MISKLALGTIEIVTFIDKGNKKAIPLDLGKKELSFSLGFKK